MNRTRSVKAGAETCWQDLHLRSSLCPLHLSEAAVGASQSLSLLIDVLRWLLAGGSMDGEKNDGNMIVSINWSKHPCIWAWVTRTCLVLFWFAKVLQDDQLLLSDSGTVVNDWPPSLRSHVDLSEVKRWTDLLSLAVYIQLHLLGHWLRCAASSVSAVKNSCRWWDARQSKARYVLFQ